MAQVHVYPFSITKHQHDIFYYDTHLQNVIGDMDNGTIPYDAHRYDACQSMLDNPVFQSLLNKVCGAFGIAYLTGVEIGLAKKIVAWANSSRYSHLVASGNEQYAQYLDW